jgi:hypothetical protein
MNINRRNLYPAPYLKKEQKNPKAAYRNPLKAAPAAKANRTRRAMG